MKDFREKNCLTCGSAFKPTSPREYYCGTLKDKDSCKKKNNLELRRKRRAQNSKTYTKGCKNCGVTFTTNQPYKIYCGHIETKEGCAFLFRSGHRYKQDLSKPKNCKKCGVEFLAKTPTHLYCGDRESKFGCSYENYLEWQTKKREKLTPEQKQKISQYKLNRRVLSKYGITVDQYYDILSSQDFKCAICEIEHNKGSFHAKLYIDHDHQNGKVRGLLCSHCNSGLGMFFESVEKMQGAIKYIQKWKN